MRGVETCGRETIEGTNYCIFHYPHKKGELVKKFNEAMREEISKQELRHPNYLDFSGFDFPSDMVFSQNFKNVYFDNAIFRGKVTFKPPKNKPNVIFEGEIWFKNAEFKGELDFRNVIIKNTAVFSLTKFSEQVWFSGSEFYKNAWFDEVTFKAWVTFDESIFHEWVIFDRSKFIKEARFEGTTFLGKVWYDSSVFFLSTWFDNVLFSSKAYFRNTIFRDSTEFTNIDVQGIIEFSDILVKKRIIFVVKDFKPIINVNGDDKPYQNIGGLILLREPRFESDGRIILKGCLGVSTAEYIGGFSLIRCELKNIEFFEEIWPIMDSTSRKVTIDELILKKSVEEEISPPYDISSDAAAQLYRRIRENYEDAKRYHEGGDFFVGEMEVLRYYRTAQSQLESLRTIQKRKWSDSGKILLTIYYYLGQYGECLQQPIAYSFLLMCFFTIIRIICSTQILTYTLIINEFFNSLFVFFQLKGDNSIDFLERVISLPLLGTLYIALKRRLERK